jgi:hypothetical protein
VAARAQLSRRASLLLLAVAATTLPASPLAAATVFEARTSASLEAAAGEQSPARLADLAASSVRGIADGERGRIDVLEGRGPLAPQGAVILTADGGKTARLYDAVTKTCRSWTPAMRPAPGSIQRELKVEKTLEEPGPVIAGQPTRHYRFLTTYETTTAGERLRIQRVEEVWVTSEAADPALRLWLPPAASTGDLELDARLAAATQEIRGVALKRTTTTSVTGDSGTPRTATSTLEVTRFETGASPPASAFVEPFDCKLLSPAGP